MNLADHIKAKEVLGLATRRDLPFVDVSLPPFSAKLDGVTDDTAALSAAVNALPSSGGGVFIPSGTLRTTEPVSVAKRNVKIFSIGKRNPQLHDTFAKLGVPGPGMIFGDFDGPIFLLDSADDINGFGLRGITLVGTRQANTAGVAFHKSTGSFWRDFLFDDVTWVAFGRPIRLTKAGGVGDGYLGMLRVVNSTMYYNQWLVHCDPSTGWNGFVFENNDCQDNGWYPGEGGVRVSGSSIYIGNNIIEGTRDPIYVRTGIGVNIGTNYFEWNPGDAYITIHDSRDFQIQRQYWGPAYSGSEVQKMSRRVWMRYSTDGECAESWEGIATKVTTPFPAIKGRLHVALNDDTHKAWAGNPVFGPNYEVVESASHSPNSTATLNGQSVGVLNLSMPTDGVARTFTASLTAAQGKWLMAQMLIRRYDAMRGDMDELWFRFSGGGSSVAEESMYSFSTGSRPGEWMHLAVAIKARGSVTSVSFNIAPYDPAAGNYDGPDVTCDITPVQFSVLDSLDDFEPGYALPTS